MGSGVMVATKYGPNPDILDLLRDLGVSERALKKMARRRMGKRKDRPQCDGRRRDGGQCQARAVCDPVTGRPSHGGKCRLHGGLSTGPRTEAGRAVIAAANRMRAALRRLTAALDERSAA